MTQLDSWLSALYFFIALQVVASTIRFGIRTFILKRLGTDDLAFFITLVLSLAYSISTLHVLVTAHGVDLDMLPLRVVIFDINETLADILLYGLATWSLKITLGLFFLRIFVARWHRITIYVVMGVTTIYGIFFFFFNLFECGNPQHFAISYITGKCYSLDTINAIAYTHAVLCAIADIILGTLPILYLRTANLNIRTKVSVGGILVLGCCGCVCTLARIAWIHDLTTAAAEWFRTAGGITVMSAAELSIGLTCLALTTYKPLFKLDFFHSKRKQEGKEAIAREEGQAETRQVEIPVKNEDQGHVHTSQTMKFGRSRTTEEKETVQPSISLELLTKSDSHDNEIDAESSIARKTKKTSWLDDTVSIDESHPVRIT